MAQLNSLIVTGDSRFLNTINGDINGTSSNVTGTVVIANGGTGGTTVATARSNLGVPAMTTQQYPALLPTDGNNNWIKVGTSNTNYGLLPSQAGNKNDGHNYLGTSSWYWKYAYIDEIHGTLKGNADSASSVPWSGVTDKPTIPSAANNGKLSIKLAGTEKASFTADQSGNSVANFTFTAGTTPSTVTKKTVITSATFNTVVTGGTTTDIPNISKKTVVTSVTPATVVTGGTTTDVPNISKKTVVTGVTKKTVVTDATFNTVVNAASYSNGVLSFGTGVSGSKSTGDSCTVTTGDSVTVGTAIKAYTSLTTGDSCTVSTGDSVTVGTAIKAYTTLNTGVSGSAQTGDSVTVTAGTAPSLSIASS